MAQRREDVFSADEIATATAASLQDEVERKRKAQIIEDENLARGLQLSLGNGVPPAIASAAVNPRHPAQHGAGAVQGPRSVARSEQKVSREFVEFVRQIKALRILVDGTERLVQIAQNVNTIYDDVGITPDERKKVSEGFGNDVKAHYENEKLFLASLDTASNEEVLSDINGEIEFQKEFDALMKRLNQAQITLQTLLKTFEDRTAREKAEAVDLLLDVFREYASNRSQARDLEINAVPLAVNQRNFLSSQSIHQTYHFHWQYNASQNPGQNNLRAHNQVNAGLGHFSRGADACFGAGAGGNGRGHVLGDHNPHPYGHPGLGRGRGAHPHHPGLGRGRGLHPHAGPGPDNHHCRGRGRGRGK